MKDRSVGMENRLTLVTDKSGGRRPDILTDEERLRHVRNLIGSLMEDAQNTWGELWNEFEGHLVEGCALIPEAKSNFSPPSGWPVFLEKFWLLKHYIDYAGRLAEGKI